MKLYIVKRKGANWWGNLLLYNTIEFSDGSYIYYEKCFHRKKDAKKYLDTFDYKEFFEIETLEFKK